MCLFNIYIFCFFSIFLWQLTYIHIKINELQFFIYKSSTDAIKHV